MYISVQLVCRVAEFVLKEFLSIATECNDTNVWSYFKTSFVNPATYFSRRVFATNLVCWMFKNVFYHQSFVDCWVQDVGFDCQLYLSVVVVCCLLLGIGCRVLTVNCLCRWLMLVPGCSTSVIRCGLLSVYIGCLLVFPFLVPSSGGSLHMYFRLALAYYEQLLNEFHCHTINIPPQNSLFFPGFISLYKQRYRVYKNRYW